MYSEWDDELGWYEMSVDNWEYGCYWIILGTDSLMI
jgi:hypothetical protein